MAAEYIDNILEIASRFHDDERNLILYFPDLESAPAPDSYNRVFGPPVGLTDERWPIFPELGQLMQQSDRVENWDPRDTRMEHVFTMDLRGVELLGAPEDAEAMMLFISNASFHRACGEDNPHTEVLFLNRADLDRGLYQGSLPERSIYRWSRRFSLVPIAVPGEVFEVPELDLLPDDLLVELFEAIRKAPARLGGCPILADDEGETPPGWGESSQTLPWKDEHATTQPGAQNLTMPYKAIAADQAEAPEAFDQRRTLMNVDRLLERNADAYADGDPASARTFGHRARSSSTAPVSSPFLMQFQRRFADVNLGQPGVMYVSDRSAYVPAA